MDSSTVITEKEWLACCGSAKFAQEMVSAGFFSNYQQAVDAARDIWFNKVDVIGWKEAFDAHPAIGEIPSKAINSPTSAQWSKGEQSTALAAATDTSLQELYEWNARYRQKFGFVFVMCACGRSSPEILAEIKRRLRNRPIMEFEVAAEEQMKMTEVRMRKLFPGNASYVSTAETCSTADVAIKEKISDLKEIRKAKAEAKEDEKAEKELAKSRSEDGTRSGGGHGFSRPESGREEVPSERHSGGSQHEVDEEFQGHDSPGRM